MIVYFMHLPLEADVRYVGHSDLGGLLVTDLLYMLSEGEVGDHY